ncbi:MAG: hypothetical protein AVDCRST_MAG56-616 [uncultured Cytophagales bacterium]|uniref:Uncharacterized protein n=1 Tax=uncultured Cytophagales bacterium TaxID=158755 RepID=A0A6J4HIL0_9SPHI|nr:MAG: hypothetical protein AVDCRST_MAG56-616 [uncultured Cytophagales bacterium]
MDIAVASSIVTRSSLVWCNVPARKGTGWRGVACWREAVLRADYGFRLWRNEVVSRVVNVSPPLPGITDALPPLPGQRPCFNSLAQASACACPSQASACPFAW